MPSSLTNYKGLQIVTPEPTGVGGLAIQNDLKKLVDWQAPVLDKDLASPPGTPAQGNRYIVGALATGAWTGHDAELAEYDGLTWQFLVPQTGWPVYVTDEQSMFMWNGTAWVMLQEVPGLTAWDQVLIGQIFS